MTEIRLIAPNSFNTLILPSIGPRVVMDEELYQCTLAQKTRLTEHYVRRILDTRAERQEINDSFDERSQRITNTSEDQDEVLQTSAKEMIKMIELDFIFDPEASTIDLLSKDKVTLYRQKEWAHEDFPGGKTGPNENLAVAMHKELRAIFPERRANTTSSALLTKAQFESSASIQADVKNSLQVIPDNPNNKKLHHRAVAAFVEMRTAAQKDGVTLIVLSAYRTPEASQEKAKKANNPNAVASFSAHNLGVAIDLKMSHSGQNFSETSTRPFSNVVGMRQSPVHKWVFLYGEDFGWYPYMNEPWHWEYNPPGFGVNSRESNVYI